MKRHRSCLKVSCLTSVLRAFLGIAEDEEGFVNFAKPCLVAGVEIVRVKSLRKHTKDALDRLLISVLADLERLVMVALDGRTSTGHQWSYRACKSSALFQSSFWRAKTCKCEDS